MSLLYLLIGFGINKDNAEYLLAGYNTMTPEQKQKFNIRKYLEFFSFFKKIMPISTIKFWFNVYII